MTQRKMKKKTMTFLSSFLVVKKINRGKIKPLFFPIYHVDYVDYLFLLITITYLLSFIFFYTYILK